MQRNPSETDTPPTLENWEEATLESTPDVDDERGGLGADRYGIVCPFPSAIHPGTAAAHARTLSWLARQGMLAAPISSRRLTTERYAWLAGRMFPAADDTTFQLLTDFTSWIFDHDDVCDETELRDDPEAMQTRFVRELALMQGASAPDPAVPAERALFDVGRRFEALAPCPMWFPRFVQNFRWYLDGCLWEAKNRRARRAPPLDEYVSLRPFAGAVWLYMELIELVLGRPLPFAVRQHRRVQELRQLTSDLAAWHNDVYSVAKELRTGDLHNLVLVLRRDRALELSEAVGQAVELCNARVRRFVDATVDLGAGSSDANEYVDALRRFVRGAYDYLLESARYRACSAPEVP